VTGPRGAGVPRSRRTGITIRRSWRWAVLVLVVAWASVAAFQLWRARAEADAGLDELRTLRESSRLADVIEGDLDVRLRRGHDHLDRAADALGSVALEPLRHLPVVGRNLRAAGRLVGGTRDVAAIATSAVDAARARIVEDEAPTGAARVRLLRSLAEVAEAAGRELESVDLGPSSDLAGPIARAHLDAALELADARRAADDAARALRAAGSLLEGPRRYLVFAANNAEMRVGTGMFLSAGVLEVRDGRLALGGMVRTPNVVVPEGAAEPTGDLAARWGWTRPDREWRNLGFTPRFAATAELAARMWSAAGRGEVDGVLAVDVVAVRAVLAATGPVEAGDRTVGADEVVDYLLHGQYAELSDDPALRHELGEQAARRERIGELAGEAVAALDDRGWQVRTLVEGLRDAAAGRHVLAWARDPGERALFDVAGADGDVSPDSLAVGLANVAGSKLDPLVRMRADLEARPARGGLSLSVRIELRNDARADEAAYLLGPDPATEGLGPGDYRGILVANLPGNAVNGRIAGVDRLVAAGADGPTRVVAATVEVPRGERRTFVVHFDLPVTSARLVVEPSARVPSVRWTAGDTRWRDERRRALRVVQSGSIAADRV